MKSPLFQHFDPLQFALGILLFAALTGQSFILMSSSAKSTPFFIWQISIVCLGGLYYLYGGIKRLRKRREQHEGARWYTQPGILVSLGAFSFIPSFVLAIVLGANTLDNLPAFIQIVLFAPIVIFWLASAFFFFRRLLFSNKA